MFHDFSSLSPILSGQASLDRLPRMDLVTNGTHSSLFPALFPALFFQLCLGCYQLALLSCRVFSSYSESFLLAPRLHFQTRLQSLWPTCFNGPSQLSSLRFSCREPHRPFFPAWIFPLFPAFFFFLALFPKLFSSISLDATSSLSSVAGM